MKEKNVKLYAVNREMENGFDIYLDFSGQREYLMSHRHNGILFGILKDGAKLDELRRNKPHKVCVKYGFEYYGLTSSKNEKVVKHILEVVEDYLEERRLGFVA